MGSDGNSPNQHSKGYTIGKKGGDTYQERPQSDQELTLLSTQNDMMQQGIDIAKQQDARSQELYTDWKNTYRDMEQTDLKNAVQNANANMGQVDRGEYGRQKANLFAGFDTGFQGASDNMNSALAKRGMANSGLYAKANKDLASEKAMSYANLNNRAYNMGVDKGDAYRQQKMSNLTGFAQLGRGMSGQSQSYLGQSGAGYNAIGGQAGSTAMGLGGLDNSYNSARWNADAQRSAGKGSAIGGGLGLAGGWAFGGK